MSKLSENFNNVLVIHRIESVINEKNQRNQDIEDNAMPKFLRSERNSMNILNQYNNLMKKGVFETLKSVSNNEFNDFERRMFDFILKERIKRNYEDLQYKSIILLNEEKRYFLIIFPEMANQLVYDFFVAFSLDFDNLENGIIEYTEFMDSSNLLHYLNFDKNINLFFFVDETFEPFRQIINKMEFQHHPLKKLVLDYDQDVDRKSHHNNELLIGDTEFVLTLKGSYNDLDFLLTSKKFVRSILDR